MKFQSLWQSVYAAQASLPNHSTPANNCFAFMVWRLHLFVHYIYCGKNAIRKTRYTSSSLVPTGCAVPMMPPSSACIRPVRLPAGTNCKQHNPTIDPEPANRSILTLFRNFLPRGVVLALVENALLRVMFRSEALLTGSEAQL